MSTKNIAATPLYSHWPEAPWVLNFKRWPKKYQEAWRRRVETRAEGKPPTMKGWAEYVAYLDMTDWFHEKGDCETCGDCRAVQYANTIYPQSDIAREERARKRMLAEAAAREEDVKSAA